MGERWPPLEVPDSDLVRDPCGWTMSGVEEERRPSGTVPEAPGAGATVTTQRMQGWSVLVCVCGTVLVVTRGGQAHSELGSTISWACP